MTTKWGRFLPLGFILLFACQVMQTTNIDIVHPAKINIPQYVNNVAITNRSLFVYDFPEDDALIQSFVNLDSLSSQRLVELVAIELNKSPRFDSIILIEDVSLRNPKYALKPLDSTSTFKLIEQNQVDALFSLEATSLNDTLIPYIYYDGYQHVSGYSFAVIVKSFWRLYTGQYEIIDKMYQDTLIIDEIENSKHYNRIVQRQDGREWLSEKIMSQYFFSISDHIAPYWYTVSRDFFIGGNDDMRAAASLALNDEWINAAKLWKKHTTSDKIRLASSACYNMGLACEVQGKLPLAIVWMDKSIALSANNINKGYKEILLNRLSDLEKLNKQFGIIK